MNVIDVPAFCGLATLLFRPVIVREPDVGVGDDTGEDGGVTGGGAEPAFTVKGTDAATLPTSAKVVASRAQRPMRYAARLVGVHVRVVALLQSRATVQLTPSKMNHLN